MAIKHRTVSVLLTEYDKTFVGTASMWYDNPVDVARFLIKCGYIKSDIIKESNRMFPSEKRATFYDLTDIELNPSTMREYLASFQETYGLQKGAFISALDSRTGSFRSLERNVDEARRKAARRVSKTISVVLPSVPSIEKKEDESNRTHGVYGVPGVSNYNNR